MSKTNTQYAKALGSIAFARGIQCAPCLDAEMQKLFAGRKVGDPRTAAEMKAWAAGWTEANLAA
jgi:hypothetical protein